jgi:hypothetical protein
MSNQERPLTRRMRRKPQSFGSRRGWRRVRIRSNSLSVVNILPLVGSRVYAAVNIRVIVNAWIYPTARDYGDTQRLIVSCLRLGCSGYIFVVCSIVTPLKTDSLPPP